jgi:hypothetical protein
MRDEESGEELSSCMGLYLLRDRGQDGNELIAFFEKRGKSVNRDDFRIDEQLQPLGSVV